jgi:dynein heavy chain 1, cytosolic
MFLTSSPPLRVRAADTLIHTPDTVRNDALLRAWVGERRAVVLVGPPGSGKTMTVAAALRGLPECEFVNLSFSSSTGPDVILDALNNYCEFRKAPDGVVLRPKAAGKWLLVFCDEVNLPEADKYPPPRIFVHYLPFL